MIYLIMTEISNSKGLHMSVSEQFEGRLLYKVCLQMHSVILYGALLYVVIICFTCYSLNFLLCI